MTLKFQTFQARFETCGKATACFVETLIRQNADTKNTNLPKLLPVLRVFYPSRVDQADNHAPREKNGS